MSIINNNQISDNGDTNGTLPNDFFIRLSETYASNNFSAVVEMVDFALKHELSAKVKGAILCFKGSALGCLEKFDESIQMLSEALKYDPTNVSIMNQFVRNFPLQIFGFGPVHYRLLKPHEEEKIIEALSYVPQVLEHYADDQKIYNNIALLYVCLGQFLEAAVYYKKQHEMAARNMSDLTQRYEAASHVVMALMSASTRKSRQEAEQILEESCAEARADGLDVIATNFDNWLSKIKSLPKLPATITSDKPFDPSNN